MITQEQICTVAGRDVYDRYGDRIGTAGYVWSDAAGHPAWASVNTGSFGTQESLVPLTDAELRDDRLVVAHDRGTVHAAPNVDATHDEPLDDDGVDRLYRHYGIDWAQTQHAYRTGAADSDASYTGGPGHDTSGPNTDDAMTRSEERLNVDTEREQVGRARLRKYVVTEQQQVTVPVTREEVRLEREPITDANRGRALDGPEISEEEHEVTLHAERPVVQTEAVPVERVRLGTETVRDTETVSGEVRKERIEADLPDQSRRGPS